MVRGTLEGAPSLRSLMLPVFPLASAPAIHTARENRHGTTVLATTVGQFGASVGSGSNIGASAFLRVLVPLSSLKEGTPTRTLSVSGGWADWREAWTWWQSIIWDGDDGRQERSSWPWGGGDGHLHQLNREEALGAMGRPWPWLSYVWTQHISLAEQRRTSRPGRGMVAYTLLNTCHRSTWSRLIRPFCIMFSY